MNIRSRGLASLLPSVGHPIIPPRTARGRQGKTRQGKTRQGETRQSEAMQGQRDVGCAYFASTHTPTDRVDAEKTCMETLYQVRRCRLSMIPPRSFRSLPPSIPACMYGTWMYTCLTGLQCQRSTEAQEMCMSLPTPSLAPLLHSADEGLMGMSVPLQLLCAVLSAVHCRLASGARTPTLFDAGTGHIDPQTMVHNLFFY